MLIPCVFKRGADGIVIPEIYPGMQWVQSEGHCVLSTIKLDGWTVKLTGKAGLGWDIHKRVGLDQWVPSDASNFLDKPIWEALANSNKEGNGIYIAYGPDINGNPQKVDKHLMIRVLPASAGVILYGHQSGIERKGSVQTFFESCKRALLEGDAEGVVFQWEEPQMILKAWGQVTRKDFGLTWPIPVTVTPSQLLGMAH